MQCVCHAEPPRPAVAVNASTPYTVQLFLAEQYWVGATCGGSCIGKRIMSVSCNGVTPLALSNADITLQARCVPCGRSLHVMHCTLQ